jgi:hypothetical protein
MGDYLLLQWLGTRRGFAFFLVLLLITAFSNLCRLADRQPVKPAKLPAKVKPLQGVQH